MPTKQVECGELQPNNGIITQTNHPLSPAVTILWMADIWRNNMWKEIV